MNENTRLLAIIVAGLFQACGPQATFDAESSSVDRFPIVNGFNVSPDSDIARHTVIFYALSTNGKYGCTATILDKAHALTAGHCLFGVNGVSDLSIGFTVSVNSNTEFRHVTKTQAAPGVDLAIITFEGGLPDGYQPVTLAKGLRITKTTPAIEAGYGKTSYQSNGSERGTLRAINVAISSIDTRRSSVKTQGVGAICNGDSGGPTFVRVGGELRQIGVHRSSDCATTSMSVLVTSYIDWMISLGVQPKVDSRIVDADQE